MPKDQRPDGQGRGGRKKKLTGEEEAWYELAATLHLPVAECREKTSATEFIRWLEFLRRRRDRTEVSHYYLAQIAFQVYCFRCCFVGHTGSPPSIESFLLQFGDGQFVKPVEGDEKSEKLYERAWTGSRETLLSILGVPVDQWDRKHVEAPAATVVDDSGAAPGPVAPVPPPATGKARVPRVIKPRKKGGR